MKTKIAIGLCVVALLSGCTEENGSGNQERTIEKKVSSNEKVSVVGFKTSETKQKEKAVAEAAAKEKEVKKATAVNTEKKEDSNIFPMFKGSTTEIKEKIINSTEDLKNNAGKYTKEFMSTATVKVQEGTEATKKYIKNYFKESWEDAKKEQQEKKSK